MLVIRKATRRDAETLLRLMQVHAAYEGSEATCTAAQIGAALERSVPLLHCWVAGSGEEALGYATATVDFSTWRGASFIHLDCLFVEERSRGSGVGRLLLNEVREFGRQLGLEHVEWQTPSWNHQAIRFYEHLGAVGRQKVRFSLSPI